MDRCSRINLLSLLLGKRGGYWEVKGGSGGGGGRPLTVRRWIRSISRAGISTCIYAVFFSLLLASSSRALRKADTETATRVPPHVHTPSLPPSHCPTTLKLQHKIP
ncbi:hypothetical protein Dimus_011973 [Dionaea muscipula]